MAKLIDIPTFVDERGKLSVIEKIDNFDIKRIYYIYGNKNNKKRGGHRHKITRQILIAISGSCEIFCEYENQTTETFILNNPEKGLLLEPKDWHIMQDFSKDCILLVLASEYYNENDYVYERYTK
ncbi:sugar 3,4-ketoisomerase [Nautilia lithotrophica]